MHIQYLYNLWILILAICRCLVASMLVLSSFSFFYAVTYEIFYGAIQEKSRASLESWWAVKIAGYVYLCTRYMYSTWLPYIGIRSQDFIYRCIYLPSLSWMTTIALPVVWTWGAGGSRVPKKKAIISSDSTISSSTMVTLKHSCLMLVVVDSLLNVRVMDPGISKSESVNKPHAVTV